MDKIIEVKNLHKHYGPIHAVKGLDFYVEKGKLFAFLGPNGAGKTTTINIICTLMTYEAGLVTINGFKLGKEDQRIRDKIGIVFQDHLLDPLLTIQENLVTRASFYTKDRQSIQMRVKDAMSAVQITDLKDRRYGELSGGQRRRADIARALINHPEILFLDEPTTGLDPQTRKNVWETIAMLQKKMGMTVFLTTHYMEEAAEADYVVVIDEGVIAAKGTPNDLKDQYSKDTLRIKPMDYKKCVKILDEQKISYYEKNDLIMIDINDTLDSIPIIDALKNHMKSFQVLNGTMDDAFIHITGKEMR
ncbi:MAG: ATP-binding cassette domain-containing protein [Acholeplasmataceae bacterium]